MLSIIGEQEKACGDLVESRFITLSLGKKSEVVALCLQHFYQHDGVSVYRGDFLTILHKCCACAVD